MKLKCKYQCSVGKLWTSGLSWAATINSSWFIPFALHPFLPDLEICSHVMWTWRVSVRENTSDLTQPSPSAKSDFRVPVGMVKFALPTVSVMVKAPLALENWLGWLSLHRMSIPAYLIADSQLICLCFLDVSHNMHVWRLRPEGGLQWWSWRRGFCPVDMCCKILVVGILDRLRPWRKWWNAAFGQKVLKVEGLSFLQRFCSWNLWLVGWVPQLLMAWVLMGWE